MSRCRIEVLFLMLLGVLLTARMVQAEDFNYITNNGTITITGYIGPDGPVEIPSTINGLPVTSIGRLAMHGAWGLWSVAIPTSITSIGEGAFGNCVSLTNITVREGNQNYVSVDDVLFDKSRTTLLQYPAGRIGTDYTTPSSVTAIAPFAFDSSWRFTSLTFSDGVTNIGNWAIFGCYSLTNITIPNSVTTIGVAAFAYCQELMTIDIGSGVTSIGDRAFRGCFILHNVDFRGNAPTLGSSAFDEVLYATAYYLPGTTGWGSTYGDRPTAAWLLPTPAILNFGPSFGVQTNQFRFRISWATNTTVVVEAATNLTTPAWLPVATNNLVDGWTDFRDPEPANHPGRFYRVRSQ